MSGLSQINYSGPPQSIEAVAPLFLQKNLIESQLKSWTVLREINRQIREGMTEREAYELSLNIFSDHGVKKHWHRPYIRFGAGTLLISKDPIQEDYRLKPGDPYYIDVGPVWADLDQNLEYEGDVGDTFILGENPEAGRCIEAARSIFFETKNLWKEDRFTGKQIRAFLIQRSQALGVDP